MVKCNAHDERMQKYEFKDRIGGMQIKSATDICVTLSIIQSLSCTFLMD